MDDLIGEVDWVLAKVDVGLISIDLEESIE
jgi:hypothetical protein